MSNYARIINDVAIDVSTDPHNSFHPAIAAEFVAVPDEVRHGSKRTIDSLSGEISWLNPPPIEVIPVATERKAVSPVQFKLLFTALERVAIKTSDDPIVKDFFEIVNDPRLTFVDLGLESTQEALQYLADKSLIGKDRPAEILTGAIQ